MTRQLRMLKARETCPRGHELSIPVSPLERQIHVERKTTPDLGLMLVKCSHPGCARDVMLTAGAVQRAA